jgi:DNA-binding transcriptional MocR family regulator
MIGESVQYEVLGTNAASIKRSIEHGVMTGALRSGDTVPSVRALAATLGVSPSTVAAAYRELRQRGVLVSHDRSRTVVAHRPPLAIRLAPAVPEHAVDLATGNPDPDLLPDLAGPLAAITPRHHGYAHEVAETELLDLAGRTFAADGLPADHLAVVGGGLDGIERVLAVHLRVGDRVAVEDPGYAGSLDLLRSLGMRPVPVPIDDDGMDADRLGAVLDDGVDALLFVPRAQNPTGAAVGPERAAQLAGLLDDHPDLLVIEDDHAAPVAGASHPAILRPRSRWAVVRSVAKWLGPGLRVAVMTGDQDTISRVLGRQRLGTGWVSQLLQELVVRAWQDAERAGTLTAAGERYAARRAALLAALAAEGLYGHGRSGLNVWIPVTEEVPVVQGLAELGWAVQAGEPFRLASGPGIRVTVGGLPEDRAGDLASDLGAVLDQRLGSRRG